MEKSIIVQLVHIQGPYKGEIQEFEEKKITIGRHPSCVLRFPADMAIISRNHADIIREGNRFKLVDHSSNGTFVNGKKVKEVYLKDGDVLTIAEGGPKVSFLTQVKEAETSQPSKPSPEPEIPQPKEPTPPPISPDQVPAAPKPKTKLRDTSKLSYQDVNVPLVIQYGPTLRSYKKVPVTIGRHPSCDFQLDHPGILDRHAEIFYVDNQYWLKDLTGQGVISVNGMRVDMGSPLNPEDELALTPEGPVFKFIGGGRLLEVEKQTPEPSPPPTEDLDSPLNAEKSKPDKPKKKGKSFFKKYLKR